MGASHVHVHRASLRAAAEEAPLRGTAMPESRSFRTRSLRCTGMWPSLARSARWWVAVAVRSWAWT